MKTKEKLEKYFNNFYLKILDNGTPMHSDDEGYTGVSVNYLQEFLFKNKITERFISRKLFELILEKKIKAIPCSYAENLLFCNINNYLYFKFDAYSNNLIVDKYDSEFFKNKIKEFNFLLK